MPADRGRSESSRSACYSGVRELILSTCCCSVILVTAVLAEPRLQHWFVIPVLVCGSMIGADAIPWLRGKIDVFDPVGILGVLGLHFFFCAPLIHVLSNFWMAYIIPPEDWRPWLGGMALLNIAGLVFYRAARRLITSIPSAVMRRSWQLQPSRFWRVAAVAVAVSLIAQIAVYFKYGGITGYMTSYISAERGSPIVPFTGMGWIFAVSESFPTVLLICIAVLFAGRGRKPSWTLLMVVLTFTLILQLLFGGLRGSRSQTMWGMFWAVGIIHFWVRPVPRTLIHVGIVFLVSFLFLYSFYKHFGTDAVQAFEVEQSQNVLGERFVQSVLGDLGRSDVQAFILYRLQQRGAGYDLAAGATYLGALALLIPRTIWPERPPTKMRWTTELEYGQGNYRPGVWQSARVYGLSGEAMLNFGPIATPFAFGLWGLLVGMVRRFVYALRRGDTRLFLIPMFVMFCFIALISDSDTNLFFLIKYGFVPISVIFAGTRIMPTKYCAS